MIPTGKLVLLQMYYGWRLVVTLGVTETVSWGVLYYAFAVLQPPMHLELGWSLGQMSGAFSLALLLNGMAAIGVGRWLDKYGPRLLMTVGSCLGVLLMLAWSRVSNLVELYLVWAGIGLTMAAVLYEPAFATVTAWFERRRPRALTVVTLFAGFASTIFLPLTSWLVGVQGWRSALVTLALVLAAATILPHALVLRRRPEDLGLGIDGEVQGSSTGGAPKPLRQSGLSVHEVMGTQSFRWLVIAFSLSVGVATALRVQLVPYLVQRGLGIGTAAAFTGTIGAMQVFGRVVVGGLSERITGRAAAVIALGMQPVALFILILARERLGLTAFVVLFGASYGAMTLVRPALLAERYGRRQYASIAGVLAFVLTLSQSALPLAAGKASDLLGSYDPIVWAFVLLSSLAVLALLAVG